MNVKLVVLDCETTGLEPDTHGLLSVGLVVWSSGVLIDELEVSVHEPNMVYDPEAMEVNRIDICAHQQGGRSPVRAAESIITFLRKHYRCGERAVIAGHNVWFDVAFLKRMFDKTDVSYSEVFARRIVDTASIMMYLYMADRIDSPISKLDDGLRHFGVDLPPDQRHAALADSRATAMLLTKLVDVVKPSIVNERRRP